MKSIYRFKFVSFFFFVELYDYHSNEAQNRKQSLDDINLDQFLKVCNYEDTVKELDIYYGIGELNLIPFQLEYWTKLIEFNWSLFLYVFHLPRDVVKRQLLQFQSPISGLFPVLSTDTEVGSVRDSVYCAAAVWSLYQAYRFVEI